MLPAFPTQLYEFALVSSLALRHLTPVLLKRGSRLLQTPNHYILGLLISRRLHWN